MSRFAFCIGVDERTWRELRGAAAAAWGEVWEAADGPLRLVGPAAQQSTAPSQTATACGVVWGYVRSDDVPPGPGGAEADERLHNAAFIDEVAGARRWPLGPQWTGSFTAAAWSKARQELILCNDIIGYRPVYYARLGGGYVGATNLIVLGRCIEARIDPIGLLEHITLEDFCHYGRRTLLAGVSRLLPGEWQALGAGRPEPESRFDNTLCQDVLSGEAGTVARTVWDCMRREIRLAAGDRRVYLALSGGWDSRHVLAAVADRADRLRCLTYGNSELYESRIAARCAAAVGAAHQCFGIEGRYFPDRSRMERLVGRTEAVRLLHWNAILEEAEGWDARRDVLLLGDHCAGIKGANILELFSRTARVGHFLTGACGRRSAYAPATAEAFDKWKARLTAGILREIVRSMADLAPALAAGLSERDVVDAVTRDLDLSFGRVWDNRPPFRCMFDELFLWFHDARGYVASQSLLMGEAFRVFDPGMSLRFLRLISRVHPHLRSGGRLADAIANLQEFDTLARIPCAQVPWVSGRSPAWVRGMVWGLRWAGDKALTSCLLLTRYPGLRQRVLASADLLAEYRRDGSLQHVREWFSGRWVRPDKYVGLAEQRARMSAWPLINRDIATVANASILLDLCRPAGEAGSRGRGGQPAPLPETVRAP